jgi:hypothetical protein
MGCWLPSGQIGSHVLIIAAGLRCSPPLPSRDAPKTRDKLTVSMGQNRIFFPQAALDQWVEEGTVELLGDVLTIAAEGRSYRIIEASRFLCEVAGAGDENQLVGKVMTRGFLHELGAEVLEDSVILGENAYDVVCGFLAVPIGTLGEHIAGPARAEARRSHPDAQPSSDHAPESEEALLVRFLIKGI